MTVSVSDPTVKTIALIDALDTLNLPGLERNLFSSRDWLEVLYATYRLKLCVKYIEQDGGVVSYIVYSVVHNFLEWKICICSYCDYCDCYVRDADDWRMFIKSLQAEYPRYRIAIRNLRDATLRQCPELTVLSKERYHLLDVGEDLEVIWKRTHDSFKSAVKQGQKAGVVVRRCSRPELEKFYDLHLRVRKNKYHVFPQPFKFFDNIWRQYMEHDKGVLLGAYDPAGRFIGGNVYLICGDTLYYKFNTSSLDCLKFRPNNLLFWEGIKYAKERGLQYLDLGSSGYEQHGLILFKDHTGAKIFDITHLGCHPPDYKFSQKRILRVMTKIFTMPWMPNALVKAGSHVIYPFLG